MLKIYLSKKENINDYFIINLIYFILYNEIKKNMK